MNPESMATEHDTANRIVDREPTIAEHLAERSAFPMTKYTYLDMIVEWLEIKNSDAPFPETILHREWGITNNANKQHLSEALNLLCRGKLLEPVENKFRWFRRVNKNIEPIDYINATDNELDLWLPFEITDLIQIYSGIIIFAGAPNTGKTCIALNIARENQHKGWNVHYFNSEMRDSEMRVRLQKFPFPLESWNINAYHRSYDFEDVIKEGPNELNIIDYFEVHDEFYSVGSKLKKMAQAVGDGVVVCCIQKNPGQDTGLGGYRTLEICRLAFAVDYGKVKVVKAKSLRDPGRNPYMASKQFSIYDGHNLTWKGSWQRPKE